ncbi:MAG: ATP-grasp domain-containing protein [Calditrichaeota bacterium]|nr:ATP-grasp domain-containing protein [Calditrichota bacterium]
MKQKILVGAGGTATAYHIGERIYQNYSDTFDFYVCDTNPAYLVPSSNFAKKFFRVPEINDHDYKKEMLNLFTEEGIHIYVPLIDNDVYTFFSDQKGSMTKFVSPKNEACKILGNKIFTYAHLENHGIKVPFCYNDHLSAIDKDGTYFYKPILGFGSRNSGLIKGEDVHQIDLKSYVIQELCATPEVTIEVYNFSGTVKSICRERLQTKAGVCTKARLFYSEELNSIAKKICEIFEMPPAFCFQVMKNDNSFCVTDLNPRLGAGTSMSTAAGWSLVDAFLDTLAGNGDTSEKHLKEINSDIIVLRVYKDIIMSLNK